MKIKRQLEVNGIDTDVEFDPSNVKGDDEEVLTGDGLSNLKEEDLSEDNEIAKVFRIEIDIFLFETPLCKAFKEFNHLLQIDVDVLIGDLPRFKTYEDYKNAHALMDDGDDIGDLDDYLIPNNTPYYIDEEEERFKERRSKLLRIPYEKPPTFKSEKFSLGPAEEYVAIKEYEYDFWVLAKKTCLKSTNRIFTRKTKGGP
uniref:Uncharacterized protein n=1 Tax=Tanacetum cinerariifolium TaxID=118510 RepID=A0A6L2LX50_TANCI|nr:hypothetical protein [Tanacetum cinerariifolium]